MKIITLNTWQEKGPWQERWKITFKEIETYQPDVICFQEVFKEGFAVNLSAKLGLPYFYYPEISSGLLTLSRFPMIRSDFIQYKTKSPNEAYNRYLTWVMLKMGESNLSILNTHLSWLPQDGEVRQKQMLELLDFSERTEESLLMGDFNTIISSPEIKGIKENWDDLFAMAHPEDPGYTWNNRNPYAAGSSHKLPDRRIDYIFRRKGKTLLKNLSRCTMIFDKPSQEGVYASDHFGLLAEFN